MRKLKECSFCFITSIFIKKFCFIFFITAVVFITNGFFIFNIEKVFADSANITQINVTTDPQTIDTDVLSSVISVQTQNLEGLSEKVSDTTHLILSSTSSTGKFYNANATSCTNILEEPFRLTMNNGSANKNFCYQDSTPGTYTLDISAEGKTWDHAVQDIVIDGENDGGGDDGTSVSYTEITEDITTDTTWTKENSPYVIRFPINVSTGVTLFIEDGVIVKFDNEGSLVVDGKLEAQGTTESPIYFTSILDDSVGGDTNNDGEETAPDNGDWDYILIESSTLQSVLNNINILYSNEGLVLYNGGSVISDSFNSNTGILAINSDGSFLNLTIPRFEIYNDSSISIDGAVISGEDESIISIYNGSTLILKNSTLESFADNPVNIYKNSSAEFNTVTIQGDILSSAAFSVYDNSTLDINNSFVLDIYNGFWVYNNSTLNINDTDVECFNDGISVYDNSFLNFSRGNVSCLHDGLLLFNEITADIDGVKISNAMDAGIIVFNNTAQIPVIITKSEISENNYGFIVFDSFISVHQNSIHDNFINGAYTMVPVDLDFTSNYWGDPSGPTHITNPDGVGDEISDNIIFIPFLQTDPLAEIIQIRNPVILIPGITGTYLYKNYGDKEEIWPNINKMFVSLSDDYLNDLVLDIEGKENDQLPVVPGDIIRGISSVHVFDKLIETLLENGYVEGTDLFVFPYDWRFSTQETSELLKEKIDSVLNETGNNKVDIIAHSMGGLIAKKYIADNGGDRIDQLIFLGTPQLGAPKAFKTLMFGDDMSYKFLVLGLNSSKAKYISQNMPSVYELLPSEKYTEYNSSYVTNALNKDIDPIDLDYDGVKDFLIESGRNEKMFPFAENLHNNIDNLDLSNIKSYNFVGCSSDTIGKITLKRKLSWKGLLLKKVDDYELSYTDGDGTVPFISANKTIGSEMYYVNGVSHGSLPSSQSVINGVMSILEDTGVVFDNTLADSDVYCGIKGDVVSVHSPVELHIYDEEGNHVGPNENGDVEYGITGVDYDVLDESKYAFLPYGKDYKIITKATDTGGYDLMIESQEGNNITSSHKWTLIPLQTLNTKGEIWVGPDYLSSLYEVKVDEDGDGDIDNIYQENYDGTKEAENIVYEDHDMISFGSMLHLDNNIIPKIEKKLDDNKDKIVLSYSSEINSGGFNQENHESEKNNKEDIKQGNNMNSLIASADNSGITINLIWPATVIFGLLLILLAKMFIKL